MNPLQVRLEGLLARLRKGGDTAQSEAHRVVMNASTAHTAQWWGGMAAGYRNATQELAPLLNRVHHHDGIVLRGWITPYGTFFPFLPNRESGANMVLKDWTPVYELNL